MWKAAFGWPLPKEHMSQVMSRSSVIGNMQHWKFNTTRPLPKPTKTSHNFLSQGMWLTSQQGYTCLLRVAKEKKKKKRVLSKCLPAMSSARSSSLVKIFWNLQSNFCLCGQSILLWFVLTTMTLNLRSKMMAMTPLTIFSWIQSHIGEWMGERGGPWLT